MKLAYLGPTKTYSEMAAMKQAEKLTGNAVLVPLGSLEAVAKSLRAEGQEKADYAIMACYNFLEGLVQECLDLIYENQLTIIGAQRIAIEFTIGCAPGSKDFGKVYSHPKALAQCSDYLRSRYPQAVPTPMASTAIGAKTVSEGKTGLAIASKAAVMEFGLDILGVDVGNQRHGKANFTDFYLVGTQNRPAAKPDAESLTMIAITPRKDRRGLLAEILAQVAYFDLNIAKIHSRPALDEVASDVEPQMFYLEIMSHQDAIGFQKCVDSLRYKFSPPEGKAEVVRILGSYPKPSL